MAKIVTIGGAPFVRHGLVEHTLAMSAARKAVKAQWFAQGRKLQSFGLAEINRAAMFYLYQHPELLAEAAETVRNDPQLRTLAEREARQRKGNRQ